ncbi:Uncharacterised protein [Bordetella pertussis]|nr:Uncharacterised protein [Bordetella pertussis]
MPACARRCARRKRTPQCGRWCWRARATRSSPARISGSLRVRRALPRQSMCPP